MPIDWDEPINGSYTLEPDDVIGLPEENFREFIRNALLTNPKYKKRYYDGNVLISENIYRYYDIYEFSRVPIEEELIKLDTGVLFNIAENTFKYCCNKRIKIPLIEISYSIRTKFDFLIFLFKLGQEVNPNECKILELTPELKKILLGNSNINEKYFDELSYFRYLENILMKEIFLEQHRERKFKDEQEREKCHDESNDFTKSIFRKEILEYFNCGYSVEIKLYDSNPEKLLPIYFEYYDETYKNKISKEIVYNKDSNRFFLLQAFRESERFAVNLKETSITIANNQHLPIDIEPILPNKNKSLKIKLNGNDAFLLMRNVFYSDRNNEPIKNILGIFYKIFQNKKNDLLNEMFVRTLSVDDKGSKRTYEYFCNNYDQNTPMVYSIRSCELTTKDLKKSCSIPLPQFHTNNESEVNQVTELIWKEFRKYHPELDKAAIKSDLKTVCDSPVWEKGMRLKPVEGNKYNHIPVKQKLSITRLIDEDEFVIADYYNQFRDLFDELSNMGKTNLEIKKEILDSFAINESQYKELYSSYEREFEMYKSLTQDAIKDQVPAKFKIDFHNDHFDHTKIGDNNE